MSWYSPFHRRDENTRTCWGYTFQLTPEHLTLEQSHPAKHSYDVLGEECLDILNQISPPEPPARTTTTPEEAKSSTDDTSTLNQTITEPTPTKPVKLKRDLYALLEKHKDSHPKLQELWNSASNPPFPVSWDQIARGQDVFYRYTGPCLTGLAFQSLLGGMGAGRVVETLSRTGGFNVRVARHRLFETTQHILECTRDLTSIQPGGDGFASSLRVRLLHAAVRKRIMTLTATHPTYYSVSENGIPINDLDCIGTISTFSATILYLSLPRQGIHVSAQEAEDYVALWRLVAHYTGTPTDHFSSPAKARRIMESLLMNEIHPTPLSGVLANNIILALENTPPGHASRSFLLANTRWLNGHDLCDALNLGRPGIYYYLLTMGQCLFFIAMTWFYRLMPASFDEKKVKMARKLLWAVIVEGKMGLQGQKSVFDMKYIPDLGKGTAMGGGSEVKGGLGGVEGRSLRTLGVLVLSLVAGGWVLGKAVVGVVAVGRWAVAW